MLSPVLKRVLVFSGIALLGYGVYYTGQMARVLTGFGAKQLCSCVFVSERTSASVLQNELNRFPYNLAFYEVNRKAQWAGSRLVFGKLRKAVYREGLGCVLLTDEDQFARAKQDSFTPPSVAHQPLPESKTIAQVDYDQIEHTLNDFFGEPDSSHLQNTKAVVVLYRDTLVAERYAPGFTAGTRMPGWSMAKSVTSALIGVLVRQGKLSVDDPAPVAAWQQDERAAITLDDMLRMQSGLAWNESYFTVSNVTRMLFMAENMAEEVIKQPSAYAPGTEWYYSSGTTNVLSRIIRQEVGEGYLHFPYQQLFGPLGMTSAVWETDLSGTPVGSSYLFATTRDWARFGLLYLKDGWWKGTRILPSGWVAYTATPVHHSPLRKYGAHFWLNAGEPENPQHRLFPDVPADLLFAEGFDGQNIFVIPSRALVVVRLGVTTKGNFDQNRFLKELLLAFPSNE